MYLLYRLLNIDPTTLPVSQEKLQEHVTTIMLDEAASREQKQAVQFAFQLLSHKCYREAYDVFCAQRQDLLQAQLVERLELIKLAHFSPKELLEQVEALYTLNDSVAAMGQWLEGLPDLPIQIEQLFPKVMVCLNHALREHDVPDAKATALKDALHQRLQAQVDEEQDAAAITYRNIAEQFVPFVLEQQHNSRVVGEHASSNQLEAPALWASFKTRLTTAFSEPLLCHSLSPAVATQLKDYVDVEITKACLSEPAIFQRVSTDHLGVLPGAVDHIVNTPDLFAYACTHYSEGVLHSLLDLKNRPDRVAQCLAEPRFIARASGFFAAKYVEAMPPTVDTDNAGYATLCEKAAAFNIVKFIVNSGVKPADCEQFVRVGGFPQSGIYTLASRDVKSAVAARGSYSGDGEVSEEIHATLMKWMLNANLTPKKFIRYLPARPVAGRNSHAGQRASDAIVEQLVFGSPAKDHAPAKAFLSYFLTGSDEEVLARLVAVGLLPSDGGPLTDKMWKCLQELGKEYEVVAQFMLQNDAFLARCCPPYAELKATLARSEPVPEALEIAYLQQRPFLQLIETLYRTQDAVETWILENPVFKTYLAVEYQFPESSSDADSDDEEEKKSAARTRKLLAARGFSPTDSIEARDLFEWLSISRRYEDAFDFVFETVGVVNIDALTLSQEQINFLTQVLTPETLIRFINAPLTCDLNQACWRTVPFCAEQLEYADQIATHRPEFIPILLASEQAQALWGNALCQLASRSEAMLTAVMETPAMKMRLLAYASLCEKGAKPHYGSAYPFKALFQNWCRYTDYSPYFPTAFLPYPALLETIDRRLLFTIAQRDEAFAVGLLAHPELIKQFKPSSLLAIAEQYPTFANAWLADPEGYGHEYNHAYCVAHASESLMLIRYLLRDAEEELLALFLAVSPGGATAFYDHVNNPLESPWAELLNDMRQQDGCMEKVFARLEVGAEPSDDIRSDKQEEGAQAERGIEVLMSRLREAHGGAQGEAAAWAVLVSYCDAQKPITNNAELLTLLSNQFFVMLQASYAEICKELSDSRKPIMQLMHAMQSIVEQEQISPDRLPLLQKIMLGFAGTHPPLNIRHLYNLFENMVRQCRTIRDLHGDSFEGLSHKFRLLALSPDERAVECQQIHDIEFAALTFLEQGFRSEQTLALSTQYPQHMEALVQNWCSENPHPLVECYFNLLMQTQLETCMKFLMAHRPEAMDASSVAEKLSRICSSLADNPATAPRIIALFKVIFDELIADEAEVLNIAQPILEQLFAYLQTNATAFDLLWLIADRVESPRSEAYSEINRLLRVHVKPDGVKHLSALEQAHTYRKAALFYCRMGNYDSAFWALCQPVRDQSLQEYLQTGIGFRKGNSWAGETGIFPALWCLLSVEGRGVLLSEAFSEKAVLGFIACAMKKCPIAKMKKKAKNKSLRGVMDTFEHGANLNEMLKIDDHVVVAFVMLCLSPSVKLSKEQIKWFKAAGVKLQQLIANIVNETQDPQFIRLLNRSGALASIFGAKGITALNEILQEGEPRLYAQALLPMNFTYEAEPRDDDEVQREETVWDTLDPPRNVDHCKILGVSSNATREAIDAAYLERVQAEQPTPAPANARPSSAKPRYAIGPLHEAWRTLREAEDQQETVMDDREAEDSSQGAASPISNWEDLLSLATRIRASQQPYDTFDEGEAEVLMQQLNACRAELAAFYNTHPLNDNGLVTARCLIDPSFGARYLETLTPSEVEACFTGEQLILLITTHPPVYAPILFAMPELVGTLNGARPRIYNLEAAGEAEKSWHTFMLERAPGTLLAWVRNLRRQGNFREYALEFCGLFLDKLGQFDEQPDPSFVLAFVQESCKLMGPKDFPSASNIMTTVEAQDDDSKPWRLPDDIWGLVFATLAGKICTEWNATNSEAALKLAVRLLSRERVGNNGLAITVAEAWVANPNNFVYQLFSRRAGAIIKALITSAKLGPKTQKIDPNSAAFTAACVLLTIHGWVTLDKKTVQIFEKHQDRLTEIALGVIAARGDKRLCAAALNQDTVNLDGTGVDEDTTLGCILAKNTKWFSGNAVSPTDQLTALQTRLSDDEPRSRTLPPQDSVEDSSEDEAVSAVTARRYEAHNTHDALDAAWLATENPRYAEHRAYLAQRQTISEQSEVMRNESAPPPVDDEVGSEYSYYTDEEDAGANIDEAQAVGSMEKTSSRRGSASSDPAALVGEDEKSEYSYYSDEDGNVPPAVPQAANTAAILTVVRDEVAGAPGDVVAMGRRGSSTGSTDGVLAQQTQAQLARAAVRLSSDSDSDDAAKDVTQKQPKKSWLRRHLPSLRRSPGESTAKPAERKSEKGIDDATIGTSRLGGVADRRRVRKANEANMRADENLFQL